MENKNNHLSLLTVNMKSSMTSLGKKTLLAAIILFQVQAVCLAASTIEIPSPADLPPGALNYDSPSNLPLDANIIAAIIGVVGLLVGSFITIGTTIIMRHFDIQRENKREELLFQKERKEKAYQIKQEIYKNFLHELAQLETFNFNDFESFKKEWTKSEVKVDLVASMKLREAKEKLQLELFNIGEKNIKQNTAQLSPIYLKNRDILLEAIREDIDITEV